MANRLKHYRDRANLTQTALAKLVHSGRSTIAKLEAGTIPLTDRWLERLAEHLDCTPADILGDLVPVVGKVGAGGSIIFEDIASNEDTVKRPPGATGSLVALEVDGYSMLPKFDPGDLVFISRDWSLVDDADIGSYCVVRLTSGETFLKILARGSRRGSYTLRSTNAPDMEDVEVEWATPVRAITPKTARRFS